MTEKVKIDPIIVNIEENFRWVVEKLKRKGREILSDFEITPLNLKPYNTLLKRAI